MRHYLLCFCVRDANVKVLVGGKGCSKRVVIADKG